MGVEPDISNFIRDVNFQYVDFAKREDEFATFRIQDFTWDEEDFSTIARFDEDTAQCLDEKFRTIYNLTYGTMGGHTSIDTSLFRPSCRTSGCRSSGTSRPGTAPCPRRTWRWWRSPPRPR